MDRATSIGTELMALLERGHDNPGFAMPRVDLWISKHRQPILMHALVKRFGFLWQQASSEPSKLPALMRSLCLLSAYTELLDAALRRDTMAPVIG